MFFIASKLFDFALTPLTWIIIFLVFGYVKAKKRWLAAGVAMLIFFTNPFLANKAMQLWETDSYPAESLTETYDVAILFGGSLRYYNDATKRPVYSQSVDRLLQTISLYKNGKVKKILISGGSGLVLNQSEREADIMIDVFEKAGVPSRDLIIERDSRNTYENAAYSAKLLDKKGKYLLVTSAFHMPRSMACFKRVGLEVHPFPVDEKTGHLTFTPDTLILPDSGCLLIWDTLLHEWFGILIYTLTGYI